MASAMALRGLSYDRESYLSSFGSDVPTEFHHGPKRDVARCLTPPTAPMFVWAQQAT